MENARPFFNKIIQLRQCEEKLEEVELTNEHLEKRLEKIRAARQKS